MLGHILIAAAASSTAVSAAPNQAPPLVDLRYALHQGALNTTSDVYIFSNIRYADPPLGKHRFKPARRVSTVDRAVNNGSVGYKCRQGYPEWLFTDPAAKLGVPTSSVRQRHESKSESDPTQNEDCLFLDVFAPRKSYERRPVQEDKSCTSKGGAPVMVWIHGGGYALASKDDLDPTGLIARSQEDGREGVVVVRLNYRLGMYGWLNGVGDTHVSPNVGLLDQRRALEWVQENIHLFGGDPDDVTVFGQSAGGGSIMLHITAEGGRNKAPFNRAISMSPGFQPYVDLPGIWNRTLTAASKMANRTIQNGAELAALDQTTLLRINNQVVGDSPFGGFTFGPTVDGEYVPDLPGVLLSKGMFDKNLSLMLGHTSREALTFTDPRSDTEAEIRAHIISTALPGLPQETIEYILTDLYPPASKTDLYPSEYERFLLFVSELFFSCNTRHLATAFGNETWNYRFQAKEGAHGQDPDFVFYNGDDDLTDANLARSMQLYFTQFAQSGTPNGIGSLPEWPLYGQGAQLTTFGNTTDGNTSVASNSVGRAEDETKNKRCEYWQTGVRA